MKKHLVLLHGFGTDSRVFDSFAGKLSKDYDPVIVDIPGHGQTKGDFGDFSFCANTILSVLEQFLKEPYHLIGWSMGGQIALEMYRQKCSHKCSDENCGHDHNPIRSLTLISSTPKFVASDDFPVGMNKAVFNKFKKGIKDDPAGTMDGFYSMIFSDKENGSPYLPDLKTQTPSPKTLMDCMQSFESFDERPALPLIKVPVLIITGNSDKIIEPKASMYMSQEIKGSKIIALKGCGHAPHMTREKEVINELTEFIG